MKTTTTLPQTVGKQSVQTLLVTLFGAGLLVGILDELSAIAVYTGLLDRFSVPQLMRFIASGAFGELAFSGGAEMVAWGIGLHFLIAYSFAIPYVLAFPYVGLLQRHQVLSGLLYGLFIWLVMNWVVLPLSQTPKAPFEWLVGLLSLGWHMLLVGLPFALFVAYRYKTQSTNQ
jgi:hypothetical protein